jgi:CheY-like chemotaxis protein
MPVPAANNETRPTAILAEDDPELCSLLAFCLYQAGYCVVSCHSGIELLDRVQSGLDGTDRPIELIITDIRMPGLTGLEVLESYHDLPGLPPTICMTAFGDRETHERAIKLRAAAVIDKPFDIDKLLQMARQLCPPGIRHHSSRSLS